MEISCITVDCDDPGRLAEFWSEALGWEIAHVGDDGLMIGAAFAWEEEFPPEWPYRNVVLRDPEENEFCLGNEPRRR